jgi:hypothetical protein
MVDRYTKAMLTVIAVALAVIALKGVVAPPAVAQFGASGDCGSLKNPCYIEYSGGGGFPIEIR